VKVTPALLLTAVVLCAAAAHAGHEITFYPSYYPQEISVRFAEPGRAAALLREKKIHAYAGGDPFGGGAAVPAHVRWAESLGGLVVLAFQRTSGAFADAEARCAAGPALTRALGAAAPFVVHPYPVTPYHEDYVLHYDLVQRARARAPGRAPRVRALPGPLRDAAAAAGLAAGADADAMLYEVSPAFLLADAETRLLGWTGPPWLKEGWFHAWLLQASASPVFPRVARRLPEELFRRRTEGGGQTPAERVALERRLVAEAGAGCERIVLGYTVRREPINDDYSEGVQNVAADSQAGLASEIFVRTAKLKDFPWNGWLNLAVVDRLHASEGAWNPVAGFTGQGGRLVWAAIGDPALLLDPDSGRFVPNRARPMAVTPVTEAPADALAPGTLRPLGTAAPAGSKVVYRVLLSKTHDGQRMTVADILYPYAFAARWSTRGGGGRRYDPVVERATALARRSVVAVRVLGVRKEIKDLGDMQLMYDVPEIEVYLKPGIDPRDAPVIAPPWSPVPWQVLALMEEAVARGVGAFSRSEAASRNVPWLDVVKGRAALASVAAGLERQRFVPEALRGFVSADDARQRWIALREFARTHRHYLPTAGPYLLGKVTPGQVTLPVFRDLSYPLGVGSFDQYPIPVRAFVTRAERRGERLEIQAEVENVEKFERSYKIVREPFRPQPASEKFREPLTVHWVALGPNDEVAAAGASREVQNGRLVVDLAGRLKPGTHRVQLALALNGNLVNAEVKVVPY
jgi:hypothetical protein